MTGEKIRELRKKHRYSQKQLADKIGVAQTAISGWETGSRGITLDVLVEISTALGEPISALLPEQTSSQVKGKLDMMENLETLTPDDLLSEGEMLSVSDHIELETVYAIDQVQRECDELLKKHLMRIPDKAILREIHYIFFRLNKIGKYELLQRAIELETSMLARCKRED